MFWEIVRFAIVSVANTVIDLLTLNGLLLLFPTQNATLLVAYNSVAYTVGALNSFVLNKYWTFHGIEHYDAVLGYRVNRQDTWMRKLNAWGWTMLVSIVFDIKGRDIDCAFKLYRAEIFRRFVLETRGAMINAEILYKMK